MHKIKNRAKEATVFKSKFLYGPKEECQRHSLDNWFFSLKVMQLFIKLSFW